MHGEVMMGENDAPARLGYRYLDESQQRAIISLAAAGTPIVTIADLLGISRRSLQRWIYIGENEPDGPYGPLAMGIRKGRAEYQQKLHGVVNEAALEDPKWAAFLLEKHFPREFGRGAQVEVHNHVAEPVNVIDVSDKPTAALEAELEEMD